MLQYSSYINYIGAVDFAVEHACWKKGTAHLFLKLQLDYSLTQ